LIFKVEPSVELTKLAVVFISLLRVSFW